jgi:hypothetical protein
MPSTQARDARKVCTGIVTQTSQNLPTAVTIVLNWDVALRRLAPSN